MSSAFPADLLAEMKGLDRVFSVFELDFSTTLRFAEKGHALMSDSLGLYLPYIESASLPTRTANTVEFSFETSRGSVSIRDVDRVLQKEHGGPLAAGVHGRAARWKLVSPAGEPFTLHDLVLMNHGMSASGIYTYEVAPQGISAIDSVVKLPVATRDLFPNIPQSKVDSDLALVYGAHRSSAATGSSGMLPCVPIGEVSIWVFAVGACEGVDQVYVGGAIRPSADWDFLVFGRGNHQFSAIIMTGTPAVDDETDTVTVDARGLTDDPSGSGTLLENPIAIARNLMANFVYSNGHTAGLAAWADESTLPMATSILDTAETYYANRSSRASLYATSAETPRAIMARLGQDWNAAPFFSIDQKFAMGPEDGGDVNIYGGEDHHLIETLRQVAAFGGMETQRGERVTGFRTSRVLNRATNSFAKTVTVADRELSPEILGPFEMETSRASVF